MQRLEVSGAVRPIYGSLGVKRLIKSSMKTVVLLPQIPCSYILFKESFCVFSKARLTVFDLLHVFVSTNCKFPVFSLGRFGGPVS